MQLITTTELRTKSRKLVEALNEGKSVDLIHRSKIIGVFKPVKKTDITFNNLEDLEEFIDEVKPTKIISRAKRRDIIQKNILKKHG